MAFAPLIEAIALENTGKGNDLRVGFNERVGRELTDDAVSSWVEPPANNIRTGVYCHRTEAR
jgi:hypothetical protein